MAWCVHTLVKRFVLFHHIYSQHLVPHREGTNDHVSVVRVQSRLPGAYRMYMHPRSEIFRTDRYMERYSVFFLFCGSSADRLGTEVRMNGESPT